MDISTSQIGQNFAGVNSNRDVQADKPRVESANVEENGNQPGQKNNLVSVTNAAQVNSDSADNFQREDRSQQLDIAVEEIQSFLQGQNRNLAFSVDEDTKRSVVTVKDSSSGDVIRQIPSEEVLRLAERLNDLQQDIGSSVGVLFNKQV